MYRKINYLLACCKFGQKKLGVDKAPQLLLKKIYKKNNYINLNVKESIINNNKFVDLSGYNKLYNKVKYSLENNEFPVILGGDHSVSLASVAASFDIFKEDLTVIWLDAHADINTIETSNTGNLHGMPLASVFNLMKPLVKSNYQPKYDQLIYLGLRDIDEAERKLLDKKKILYFGMDTIRKIGIQKTCEIINKKTKKNIHLSFDVDVLDPLIAPATGTPVDNGMLINEAEIFINNFKYNNIIRTLDFVEYNPYLFDLDNRTLDYSSFLINKIIN